MLSSISNCIGCNSFHTNPYSILLVSFLCLLSMIIALLCGFKFTEYQNMTPALNTKIYMESATVLFISTIPAMIDALIDTSQIRKLSILSPWYVGRLLVAIACFLSATQFKFITEYASIFGITKDPSLSYVCTLLCLRLTLVCSMLLILNLSNPTIFKNYEVSIVNFISCLSTILRFYSIGSTNQLSNIAAVTTVITFACIVFYYVIWIYRLLTNKKAITVNDYTSILYFITVTIIAIIAYAPIIQQWLKGHFFTLDVTHYTPSNLALVNYGLTILTIILNIVPGRIARYEAYVYMNNNIKVKTDYVRFISHELRTPLNSVFLGLNLSINQIAEHTECEEEKERRDTLMEIASACSAALDILNQLLFFDKLDNGILELNKSKTRVTELIHDALKMFTVQIREKNIDMKIHNNSISIISKETSGPTSLFNRLSPRFSSRSKTGSDHGSSSKPECYGIYMNEMIEIDKNKMTQVIRNIVSNAIKFTPEYGQISINLKFETNPYVSMTSKIVDTFKKRVPIIQMPTVTTSSKVVPIHITDGHMGHSHPSYKNNITKYSLSEVNLSCNEGYDNTSTRLAENDDNWNNKVKEKSINTSPRAFGANVDGYLVIEITDTGAGISEENQHRLFREVVQFKPEILQNGGGSGLGMWISKGIVDLHGGTIAVHSEGEGRGSTFTMKLPMTREYNEIQSTKLSDCIHIKDQISLNQLNTNTIPDRRNSCTNSIMDVQITVRSNAMEHLNNDEIKYTDSTDIQPDTNPIQLRSQAVGTIHVNDLESQISEEIVDTLHIHTQDYSKDISMKMTKINSENKILLSNTIAYTTDYPPDTVLNTLPYMSNKDVPSSLLQQQLSSIETTSDKNQTTDVPSMSSSLIPKTTIVYMTNDRSSLFRERDSSSLSLSSLDLHNPSASVLQTSTNVSNNVKVVLVVDDSSMNRKMLCRLLKSSGYICIEANDGVEAVTYIRDNCHCSQEDQNVTSSLITPTASSKLTSPAKLSLKHDSSYKSVQVQSSRPCVDIIFMDFMMPNMDGPTATAEIRKLGYTGPIIGATGNALQADIDYFIEKGANQVLIKPLDMTSLLSAISSN